MFENIDIESKTINEKSVLKIQKELIKTQYGDNKEFYTVFCQKKQFLQFNVFNHDLNIIKSIEEIVDEYKFLLKQEVKKEINQILKLVKSQLNSQDLKQKLLKLKIQIHKQKQSSKFNFIIKENLSRFPQNQNQKSKQELNQNYKSNKQFEQNNYSEEEYVKNDQSNDGFSEEEYQDYGNWSDGSCACKNYSQDCYFY
ncbi:hypothetical protein ABPG72_020441 [Tetrahymena utriculariae]